MGRGKTPAGFIENGTKRRQMFANRRKGLLAKAEQLSTLCGVPVAVVCADLKGGAPTVMETEAGVLDRYRALPAETRAEHTHARYLDGLLGKEKAKLARARQAGPDALKPPHADMSGMTREELFGLLGTVDAALAAAEERLRALGLPGDDDDAVEVPCGDSGPWTAGSGSESDGGGYFHPMQQGQGDAGVLDQPTIWQGLQPHGGGMMPHDHYYGGVNTVMQPAYDTQPQYNMGNSAVHLYQQQMPSNGGSYHRRPAPGSHFQPHTAIALPWNGPALQYDDGSSSSHVGTSSSWMQAPSYGNFNIGAVHDLALWSPAESSNAIAGYPYMHTSGNTPAAEYPDQFTGNNNFSDASADFLGMGVGGNGMNYLGGYETQGSTNNLQHSGASQSSSSVQELFGYGSDDQF